MLLQRLCETPPDLTAAVRAADTEQYGALAVSLMIEARAGDFELRHVSGMVMDRKYQYKLASAGSRSVSMMDKLRRVAMEWRKVLSQIPRSPELLTYIPTTRINRPRRPVPKSRHQSKSMFCLSSPAHSTQGPRPETQATIKPSVLSSRLAGAEVQLESKPPGVRSKDS